MNTVCTSTDDDILVGNEKWSYIKVVDILTTSSSSRSLFDNMFTLARRLQIPTGTQRTMENKLVTNISTHNDILYEILEAWRAKNAKKATIFRLVRELENCGLKNCADDLRKRMSQTERIQSNKLLSKDEVKEVHLWNDLSDELQNEISNENIILQDKQIKIGQLNQQVKSLMDGNFLRQAIQGKTPTMVNNQVPPRLKYYIHRQVETRSILTKNIFKDRGEHVLVIQGLERYELSSLAAHSPTDVSGNQIQKLSVRFILLELEEDYEKIAKVSKVPVHWIRFENGVYKWIKSSGSVGILQEYIDKDNQDKFDENDLALIKNKIVVISDSPGMGKTQLLVNIAHEIVNQNPTIFVFFIVLQEFVPKLCEKTVDIETIIQIIAETHSKDRFGRKFVSHVLKSEPCVLMFDGYDEVLSDHISTANAILEAVTKIRAIQIFVTTRIHMRDELERNLNALSCTIKPFSTSDQVNFLGNYWESHGTTKNESVQQLAASVLHTLTSNLTNSEQNIAGIPLQCRILAETYADDADRCSKLGFENYSDSSKKVTSVFKMYKQHMNMRFEKICGETTILKRLFSFIMRKKTKYNTIKHAHMFYALKLLFPEQVHQFQKQLCADVSVSLHELCGFGILEANHQNEIRFVHQTFAEYLVAWYVMEANINAGSKRFILSKILKTQQRKGDFGLSSLTFRLKHNRPIEGFQFDFPVICHFLNGFAGKMYEKTGNLPTQPPLPRLNYHRQLLPVYLASALQNYLYIPVFVSKLFKDEFFPECDGKLKADLVLTAACFSDVNLLKLFCDNDDILNLQLPSTDYPPNSSQSMVLTPLHVAINRGHYNLVDYLVRRYRKQLRSSTHLIHICVEKSSNNDQATLVQKKQIIKLLLRLSKQWLEEPYSSSDCTTPLLQERCSWELRECLILEGANVNAIDRKNEVVLHKISNYSTKRNPMTPESYHQILVLLTERGFIHFNRQDSNGLTPLFSVIEHIEIMPCTVHLFLSKDADFNFKKRIHNGMLGILWHLIRYILGHGPIQGLRVGNMFGRDETLLIRAIRAGRSAKLIHLLIDCGANCKYVNEKKRTVVHYSVKYNNINALEYFLTNYVINVNRQDYLGATALHYAMKGRSGHMEVMQVLLIKAGADFCKRNKSKPTPFMEAFKNGKGLTLSTIHLMEEHGLNITRKVASDALNHFEKRIKESPTLAKTFGDEIHYLWCKSGRPNSNFPSVLL